MAELAGEENRRNTDDGMGPCFAMAKQAIDHLGRRLPGVRCEGALPLWTWAREFWAVCVRCAGVLPRADSGRRRPTAPGDLSLVEIGAWLAEAEGCERAYSDSWVSNALNTAEEWASPPLTPDEAQKFLDRFRAHERRRYGPALRTPEQFRREAARKAVRGLEQAMGLGYPLDELCDLIRAALGNHVEIRVRSEAVPGQIDAAGAGTGGPREGRT